MEPILELVEVGHTYHSEAGEVTPFEAVSLQVLPGEVVAIVGPSGHGKSTLLNIMGGLLKPTKGIVRIAGQEISSLNTEALDRLRSQQIGTAFQVPYLLAALTARENLQFAAAPIARGSRERYRQLLSEIEALLMRFGLGDRQDFLPHQLSIGQRRRVALARALLGSPPLILADEPTNDLDHIGADLVVDSLCLAARAGAGVVFITHELRRIERADRQFQLESGNLCPLGR